MDYVSCYAPHSSPLAQPPFNTQRLEGPQSAFEAYYLVTSAVHGDIVVHLSSVQVLSRLNLPAEWGAHTLLLLSHLFTQMSSRPYNLAETSCSNAGPDNIKPRFASRKQTRQRKPVSHQAQPNTELIVYPIMFGRVVKKPKRMRSDTACQTLIETVGARLPPAGSERFARRFADAAHQSFSHPLVLLTNARRTEMSPERGLAGFQRQNRITVPFEAENPTVEPLSPPPPFPTSYYPMELGIARVVRKWMRNLRITMVDPQAVSQPKEQGRSPPCGRTVSRQEHKHQTGIPSCSLTEFAPAPSQCLFAVSWGMPPDPQATEALADPGTADLGTARG